MQSPPPTDLLPSLRPQTQERAPQHIQHGAKCATTCRPPIASRPPPLLTEQSPTSTKHEQKFDISWLALSLIMPVISSLQEYMK